MTVTPEMIEAGRPAWLADDEFPQVVIDIYEAMRAVDPEWVKMREALLSIATNAWSHQDDREIASDALQETLNNV